MLHSFIFLSALCSQIFAYHQEINVSQKFSNTGDLYFPPNFIFSTATASYQVEGAWNASDKGVNIWDKITQDNPDFIKNRDNGEVACDSYHKFKDDVRIIKTIGFQMYRFSISWSRLFPTGFTDTISSDGLAYYNALIDELIANDIEPYITIYHWDLPQPLQELGGWLNSSIVDTFGNYARACYTLFGDRVKWWATINEPLSAVFGYGDVRFAPALDLHGTGEYISGHNMILAHARAYRIYEKEFKETQGGKVTLILCGSYNFPATNSTEDVEAAERANQFIFGWFGHPIFSAEGDYPQVMKDYIDRNSKKEGREESRLPSFTQDQIEEVRGSFDYLGLNHYSSVLATPGEQGPDPSWYRDMHVYNFTDPFWPSTECEWVKVIPEGFYNLLIWVKNQYNNPDIFITENGYCDFARIFDLERISYYEQYFVAMLEAMREGVNVIGHTVWSLLDNLEWRDGFTKKFGIVQVNFDDPNHPRIFKLSASYFQQIIADYKRKYQIH